MTQRCLPGSEAATSVSLSLQHKVFQFPVFTAGIKLSLVKKHFMRKDFNLYSVQDLQIHVYEGTTHQFKTRRYYRLIGYIWHWSGGSALEYNNQAGNFSALSGGVVLDRS